MPRDTGFEINFSQPMRPESVSARLSIFPEVSGSFSWQDTTLRFQPEELWPEGAKVRVTLVSGAQTSLGPTIDEAYAWAFTVRSTQLAFLYPANGPADLYLLNVESGQSQQVTHIGGIQDFDLQPDSSAVFFSARNDQEGSDLYRLELKTGDVHPALDCQGDYCSMVQVSPHGDMLAYERSGADGRVAIWLLTLASREQRQLSRSGHEARLPQWSPDGLLSYYDEDDKAYYILDLAQDENVRLGNLSGELGSWSPSGGRFAVQQLTPDTFELPVDLIDKPFEVIPRAKNLKPWNWPSAISSPLTTAARLPPT